MSRVKVNEITNKVATGPVDFPDGITGVALTVTGNVTVGGTIISEDTTNVDSVGFITARAGLNVGPPSTGIGATIHSNGNAVFAGIVTTTQFKVTTGGNAFETSANVLKGASGQKGIYIRSALSEQGYPSYSSVDDTDTGIFLPGSDVFAVTTGGSERVRVDSSGRFIVGHTATSGKDATLQIAGGGGDTVDFARYAASAYGPNLHFLKSRNGTVGSHTIVQDGDALGIINFRGSDGGSFDTAAEISGEVDGTPGSGDMPGRLVFKTTADGASSATERLRITKTGGFNFSNGELIENANVTAGKLSDNLTINLDNGMVHLFTTAESTTAVPNIMSTAGINTSMSNGDAITVTLITTANAAAYCDNIQIDGAAVTENWIGGSAPSDGGSSGVDVHTFTIIKTASETFTVLGNQSKTS